MQLRVGLGLGLFLGLAFLACDDDSSPVTVTPVDAGTDSNVPDTGGGPIGDDDDTDAGGGDAQTTDPIVSAKAGEWTYVPFPDSTCANGSATGIGINPGTSKRLVIYMEGGGACWNELTCYQVGTAANLDGFDETKFKARIAGTAKSHLDRGAANNPYKDASYVYIPYCTGDVHGGDKEVTYGATVTKHFGRRNMEAFLKRIAPAFADPDRVVLTGSSAGGFGAALNYWRVKKYWATTRVDLVDDSGPAFPKEKMANFGEWLTQWDLQGAIDPACAECADGNVLAIFPHYSKTYPAARFSLLSYTRDATIRQFFGMGPATFQTTLDDVIKTTLDPLPNVEVYVLTGEAHTMLGDLTTKPASATTDLGAWLNDMNSDATGWASVKPPQAP